MEFLNKEFLDKNKSYSKRSYSRQANKPEFYLKLKHKT